MSTVEDTFETLSCMHAKSTRRLLAAWERRMIWVITRTRLDKDSFTQLHMSMILASWYSPATVQLSRFKTLSYQAGSEFGRPEVRCEDERIQQN